MLLSDLVVKFILKWQGV